MDAREFSIPSERLCGAHSRTGSAKAAMMELACRHCGITQRRLATELGVSEHAVGKQRHGLLDRLASDPALAARLAALSKSIAATTSSIQV